MDITVRVRVRVWVRLYKRMEDNVLIKIDNR